MVRPLSRLLAAVGISIGLVAVGTLGAAGAAQAAAGDTTTGRGFTQVVVDPGVAALLASAGIAPGAIAPATAGPFGDTVAARFPISGYDLRKLRIEHDGGLSLTAGAQTIAIEDLYIDLGRLRVSGDVSGSIGDVGRVDLFKIRISDRYDLGLVRLTLTSTAASALNATFGVEAFAAGATFGYATPRPLGREAARLMTALPR